MLFSFFEVHQPQIQAGEDPSSIRAKGIQRQSSKERRGDHAHWAHMEGPVGGRPSRYLATTQGDHGKNPTQQSRVGLGRASPGLVQSYKGAEKVHGGGKSHKWNRTVTS